MFSIVICTSISNMRICGQNELNQVDFLLQLKFRGLTNKYRPNRDIHLEHIKSCSKIPLVTIQEQVFY